MEPFLHSDAVGPVRKATKPARAESTFGGTDKRALNRVQALEREFMSKMGP
jgi:hypothetical protein